MKALDSVQSKYARDVFEHVYKFMNSVGHLSTDSITVALSGGVDSVSLLYLLKWIEINKNGPRIFAHHINHGTREKNTQEQKFCESLCKSLSINLKISKLNLDLRTSDFENSARKLRYQEFKNGLSEKSLMALGHHIDDSFEWSLMQQLRSSNLRSTLGIPVSNGSYIRPLMCLTKFQITKLAKALSLTWLEDPSNNDARFDRNFIREVTKRKLSKRYPQLLKHYVNRSNELAKFLNVSAFKESRSSEKILKKSWKGLAICFISTDYKSNFHSLNSAIHEAICSLSEKGRGTLHKQISKFILMGENGKSGPLEFSGGVYGYHSKGCLFLVNREGLREFELLDELTLNFLRSSYKASQIPVSDLKNKLFYEEKSFWPFLMFGPLENEASLKSLRSQNPLMPRTTKYCLENGIWFQNLSKILDISHKKLEFYV